MKTKSAILLMIIAAILFGCAANLKRPGIQEQPLAPGDRVRVSVSNGTSDQFVGNLVALHSDTLFLKYKSSRRRTTMVDLPIALIKDVEVSRGRKSNVASGFFIGAGLGAAIGVAITGQPGWCDLDEGCPALGALFGGPSFGLIGMLIGSASSGDIWEEVPLEKVRQSSLK